MPRKSHFRLGLFLLTLALAERGFSQTSTPNALDDFVPAKHAVSGTWTKTKDGLRVQATGPVRCVVPGQVGNNYRIVADFTRNVGDEVIAFLLPVGNLTAVVELSGWNGAAHGLARIDGLTSKDDKNPTAVRPGTLENKRRHRATIRVQQQAGKVTIAADLDSKKLFEWNGALARLSPHFVFKLPDSKSLGLGTVKGDVVFHSVRIETGTTVASSNSTPKTPATTPAGLGKLKLDVANPVELKGLGDARSESWQPFNGAGFRIGSQGKRLIATASSAGKGDRGAFLKDVNLENGVLEVDLKGAAQPQSSFLGVVFRAVDGKTYDAIYFRPFNFGSKDPVKRSHAVQYISHPDWPWDRLRREKNGQYESGVQPEPNASARFHARVEIQGKRVRVFVNGNKSPSLDVEMLHDRSGGQVGLWYNGIAEFSEFTVMPTK